MKHPPHQPPIVTADAVVIRLATDGLQVLTIIRERAPFAGDRALPGVYVVEGETIAEATARALSAKAGFTLDPDAYIGDPAVYDSTSRDPRGHAISIVSQAVTARPSDGNEEWISTTGVELAFDHNHIVNNSIARLQSRFWQDQGLVKALVADRPLTTRTFLHAARSVLDRDYSPSNFRRRLAASGLVIESDEAPVADGVGKPSRLWTWS